ncbi:hypothetical protein [Actinocorallia aurea]
MISDEEAAWHAEADAVFLRLLAETGEPSASPHTTEVAREAVGWLVSIALRCGERDHVEGWCLRLGRGLPPGHPMLGLVGLCASDRGPGPGTPGWLGLAALGEGRVAVG